LRASHLPAALFALVVAIPVTQAARADAPDAARARGLFEHGRELRAHGNYADALPLFQKAYALYPQGLGSLRNVAVCDEALGKPASARTAWLELRRALASTSDPKYAGWIDDADRAAAHLATQVATLTIDVAVISSPGDVTRPATLSDGIDVTLDGQALAREQLGTPIERDPGSAVVRAVGAPGVLPQEAAVVLAAGESKHVALRLSFVPAQPTESDPTPVPAAEVPSAQQGGTRSRPAALRAGAWTSVGLGVASLGGALASFAVRQSALGALGADCPGYTSMPCNPSNQTSVTSDVNRGKTASTLVGVFGALGIAGTAGGIVLLSLSRRGQDSVALVVTPTGAGAAGAF
jgi:hypothetical protein